MLRLAVDATPLLTPLTGIGVFTHQILRELGSRVRAADTDPDGEALHVSGYAVTWRRRHLIEAAVPAGVHALTPVLPARPLHACWRRSDHPRIDRALGRPDVVHGTNYVVPPVRAAQVVSVHDLSTLRFPRLVDPATLVFPGLIERAVRRGAWVHTDSEAIADEVREAFPVHPDRVVTVHLAPADRGPFPRPSEDWIRATVGSTRYVVAIGTIEPRKDLPGLLGAFDQVAAQDPEVNLVVAGGDGWGIDAFEARLRTLRHRDRVVRVGYVDDPTRRLLLAGAAVFAYPSVYEGFGLPPLEAMAAGVPVIATRAGSLPEILGDAALLTAVGDEDALAEGLLGLLADDRARAAAVARGISQVARYSWPATVDGLLDLYRRARAENGLPYTSSDAGQRDPSKE